MGRPASRTSWIISSLQSGRSLLMCFNRRLCKIPSDWGWKTTHRCRHISIRFLFGFFFSVEKAHEKNAIVGSHLHLWKTWLKRGLEGLNGRGSGKMRLRVGPMVTALYKKAEFYLPAEQNDPLFSRSAKFCNTYAAVQFILLFMDRITFCGLHNIIQIYSFLFWSLK